MLAGAAVYGGGVVALLLVAVSVGVGNAAAALAIGVSGVDARLRWRVAVVFGVFEALMPLVGLVIGAHLADGLGHRAGWVGGGLLVVVGLYTIVGALRAGAHPRAVTTTSTPALLLAGLALSLDNLVVGFALGARHVSLPLAALVFGVVSVVMSVAGLELGGRLGARAGERAELVGGGLLAVVGVAIASGVI